MSVQEAGIYKGDRTGRSSEALGLTRGVPNAAVDKPVLYVFLSPSPPENPEIQVRVLSLDARALLNRHLSQALQVEADAREVKLALKSWEKSSPSLKASPPNIFH